MAEIKRGDWVIVMAQYKCPRWLVSGFSRIPPDRYLWKIRRVKDVGSTLLNKETKEAWPVLRIGRKNARDWRRAYVRHEDCYHIPYEQMPWLGEDSL